MFPQSKQFLVVLAFFLHNVVLFSQGDMDCPSPTFFKTFGSAAQAEYATAIIQSSDNHLFLAGRDGNKTFIQKMTSSGIVIWTQEFQVSAFEPVTPSEIIEDSEGMIVGCGTQGFTGLSKGFVFRYDPVNNMMLWAQQINSNNPIAAGILEKGPGGNFIYYQTNLLGSGEKDAEIIEVDRSTGVLNPSLSKRYEYISSDAISKMIYVNGALYATGTSSCRYGNFNLVNSRQLLAQFDPGTFDPIWAHLNHLDTLAPVSFLGRDLLADGDALISAYVGSNEIMIGGVGNDTIYLQKTDLNGNLQWVRSYSIQAGVLKLLAVPDGYVIYGQQDSSQHLVFKTDKDGLPLWGRKLTENVPAAVSSNTFAPNQAVAMGDSLFFTGTASNGALDVFLWKMTADGNMVDSCGFVDTLNVESTLVANPLRFLADLSQVASTATTIGPIPNLQDATLDLNQFCPDCNVPDPCPEDNDFVLTINDVFCEAGTVNMQFTICELEGGDIPPLTISFFDVNPYLQTANALGSYDYSPMTNDSCWSVDLTDLEALFGAAYIQNGVQIFAVVNVPENADTPFDLNDFPLSDYAECNYNNNLDVYTLQLPTAPTLNLGPDQSVCPNQGALLDAGVGFVKYQWSNGQSTQIITVNFSGQFRVTVTDICGFKQIDTVGVQILQTPQLTENGSFCPGQSVTIRGITFDQSGVFQETLPGLNNECDSIITFFITQLQYQTQTKIVQFCPGDSVTINGITYTESGLAQDTLAGIIGCDTIVTYFLNQLPAPFKFDTAYICPGDSVLIGNFYYDMPGLVFDTLLATGPIGCDTVIRVEIILLPQITVNETVEFCPGSTVILQGETFNQPGSVSFIIASTSGGCDTLLNYTLEWLPSPTRDETIAFCQGASVDIDGNTYTNPGVVLSTIPGLPGECDTLVTYTLEWLPGPTRDETLAFCPGSVVVIDGSSYTQPGIVLSTVPGTGGGCDTLVTYTLEWLPAPTRDETVEFCPGSSVVIDGNTYTQPGTVLSTIPGNGAGCDTLLTYTLAFSALPTRDETIEFCVGESVSIGGQTYTQPGTAVDTLPGATGACDTVVTYTLQYLVPSPSTLMANCPSNVNVATIPGTGPIVVSYNQPTANSDCTCPGIEWTLSAGQASGSLFPPGMTTVCYTAKDSCGSSDECCFNVIVREENACETKQIGCMKYEILAITANTKQEYTYRIKVTNACANKLIYTAIQLPNGVVAVNPASNSIYESPDGQDYLVRNPNFAPFYSIRFKSTTDSISNGESSELEYTLPGQSHPTFIRIISRLSPQLYYETTLNTFNCPIGMMVQNGNRSDAPVEASNILAAEKAMLLFPNPTSGLIYADLSDWAGASLALKVMDSRGKIVFAESMLASKEAQLLRLPEGAPNGLYFLEIMTEGGERAVGRFIVEH